MRSNALRWTLVFLVCCFEAGCGSSGIEEGIPADAPKVPINPTPDMGPDPVKAPGKAKTAG